MVSKQTLYLVLPVLMMGSGLSAIADEDAALSKVVTTATMDARDSAVVPAFTTVISSEDIEKSSVSSLSDLLRDSVGVNNFTLSGGRDELRIRGLDGKYTLFLVNGKRLSSNSAFTKGSDTDLNSIPLNGIERVEIIRGPMSSLYGADAMGGVVNIITKMPTEQWQSSLNAEYRALTAGEGGDQYRLGASTRGALTENLRLSVSMEHKNQDAWYLEQADKDANLAPKYEEKSSNNIVSTLSYDLNQQQTLDLDVGINQDKRPLGVFGLRAGIPQYREQELQRFDVALTHTGHWNWGSTTVYAKQEQAKVDDYNTQYTMPANSMDRHTQEDNTYAKAYANMSLGNNALLAGVDFRQQKLKDRYSLVNGDVSINQYALFAQDEITLTDSLFLTLGGRLDSHEIFGEHFSPKGYLVWQATDGLTIKGGISQAFKAPDIYEMSEDYQQIACGGACLLPGNPDLKPESSTNYELGIELREAQWELSTVLFFNDVEDMIEADRSQAPAVVRWVNVSKVNTKGIELNGSYDITPALTMTANYTWMDTDSEDASGNKIVLTGRAKNQVNTSLNWQATPIINTFVSLNYLNGMQYQKSATEYPRVSGYYRADLGASAVLFDDFTLRGGIRNLANVRLDKEDIHYEDLYTSELGRSVYLGATYNF